MAHQFLTTSRDGAVEHVTLNRPDVRNALDDKMVAEITEWASRVADEARAGRVRVAVLSGAGKAFCAGADAAWMAATVSYTEEQNFQDALAVARMLTALDTLPFPLIGRVHGAAMGGGAGLAAVCDAVVAAEDASFGFPEVKLGIIPAVISPFVLAKIGRSAGRELFLTGARFSAARAREIGLVHAVVPAPDLDTAVSRYVSDILASSPDAIAAAKRLIREVWNRTLEEVEPLTAAAIAKRRVAPDGQEGLRAFLDKRKPSWSE